MVTNEWTWFWGQVRQIGYTQDEAYQVWGITSMKDGWICKGKTLQEALTILREHLQPQ